MILRVASFLALILVAAEAKKYTLQQQQQWEEFQEYLKWKKFREQQETPQAIGYEKEAAYETHHAEKSGPPPPDQAALMARYIVNQADWAAVATISTRRDIEAFPTANLVSFSDGPLGSGSGVPYVYLTPLDFTAKDLAKDQRATLLMSLAQGDYCKGQAMDPMDPRCARIMLSGKVKAIRNDSAEHEVAQKAFFERHPKLINMPSNHHFFLAKLKISSICVLDTFGGPKYVTVRDYLNPPVANVTAEFLRLFPLSDEPRREYSPVSNFVDPVVHVI